MSLDTTQSGKTLPPVTMTVDAGRLRFFANAIGETDPVYFDVDAAKAAGHPGLPVPPSFLFGVELEGDDPFAFLSALGADLWFVLHGEQLVREGDGAAIATLISTLVIRNPRVSS
jgi:N-terminal half of MaoC dehydratase